MSKKVLFSVMAGLLMLSAPLSGMAHELQTVKSVDLTKYEGRWYQVALVPNHFQKKCAKNAWVNYQLKPTGKISDYMECTRPDGRIKSAMGESRVVNTNTNATLSTTFINIDGFQHWFGPNYSIIGLEPNYEYAVVGYPNLQYGWVLSRTPELTQEQLIKVGQLLEVQGYDTCRFTMSPQDQGYKESTPLCDVINHRHGH